MVASIARVHSLNFLLNQVTQLFFYLFLSISAQLIDCICPRLPYTEVGCAAVMVTCGGGGQARHLPFLTNIWREEIMIEGKMEIHQIKIVKVCKKYSSILSTAVRSVKIVLNDRNVSLQKKIFATSMADMYNFSLHYLYKPKRGLYDTPRTNSRLAVI